MIINLGHMRVKMSPIPYRYSDWPFQTGEKAQGRSDVFPKQV